jgi:hypothetical protein
VIPSLLLDEAHPPPRDARSFHILLNYEWDARAPCRLSSLAFRSLVDRLAPERNCSCCRDSPPLPIGLLTDDTADYSRHLPPATPPATAASCSPTRPSPWHDHAGGSPGH